MEQRAAFVEAILATPEDDAPRLVFADWLDDHGDEHDRARAAFIREQCQAAKLAPDDPRLVDLRRREDDLLRDHGTHFSPLPLLREEWRHARCDARMNYPYRGELYWRRGFPRWLSVSATHYPSEIDNILNYEFSLRAKLTWRFSICAGTQISSSADFIVSLSRCLRTSDRCPRVSRNFA